MNMFKKNEGFTLVELIVVIAILAILAAVAVPAYSGYITKANEAADYTQLDSMKTAIVFAVAEKDPAATIKSATINFTTGTEDLKTVVVDVTESAGVADIPSVDISSLFGAADYSPKSGATKAEWKMVDGNMKWVLSK